MKLIREASAYWSLYTTDSSKAKFEKLPYSIMAKAQSINVVDSRKDREDKCTIQFRGLTLSEADHRIFIKELRIVWWVDLGWFDFWSTETKSLCVFYGIIDEHKYEYEDSGVSVTLTLKPLSSIPLNQQVNAIRGFPLSKDEMYTLSLTDVLKTIAKHCGMGLAIQTTDEIFKLDEERVKKYKAAVDKNIPADLTIRRTAEDYMALSDKPVWVQFFETVMAKPFTPKEMLLWMADKLQVEVEFRSDVLVINAINHAQVKKSPAKYFKYRGGLYETMPAFYSPFEEYITDPFEKIVIISKTADRLLGQVSVQVKPDNSVEVKEIKVNAPATVSRSGESRVDTAKTTNGDSVTFDKKSFDEAMKNSKTGSTPEQTKLQKEAEEKKDTLEPKKTVINGLTSKISAIGDARARCYGQRIGVRGLIGDSFLFPGMYFFVEARFQDTGWYIIDRVEHDINTGGTFKTHIEGTLVVEPVPEDVKKKQQKAGVLYRVCLQDWKIKIAKGDWFTPYHSIKDRNTGRDNLKPGDPSHMWTENSIKAMINYRRTLMENSKASPLTGKGKPLFAGDEQYGYAEWQAKQAGVDTSDRPLAQVMNEKGEMVDVQFVDVVVSPQLAAELKKWEDEMKVSGTPYSGFNRKYGEVIPIKPAVAPTPKK